MIGVRKRVIVAACAGGAVLMYNPFEIVEASGEYQTEEAACRSRVRPCTRYRRIKVAYLDARSRRAKVVLGLTRKSSSMKSTTVTARRGFEVASFLRTAPRRPGKHGTKLRSWRENG